jgi:hypothetical protein
MSGLYTEGRRWGFVKGRALVVLAVVFAMALALMPAAVASGPSSYLTTAFRPLSATVATEGGFKGALVGYVNTLTVAQTAYVYLDLTNSKGQTVLWTLNFRTFQAAENATLFFGFVTLPSGTYTASVFVTTPASVPLSPTTSFQVSL